MQVANSRKNLLHEYTLEHEACVRVSQQLKKNLKEENLLQKGEEKEPKCLNVCFIFIIMMIPMKMGKIQVKTGAHIHAHTCRNWNNFILLSGFSLCVFWCGKDGASHTRVYDHLFWPLVQKRIASLCCKHIYLKFNILHAYMLCLDFEIFVFALSSFCTQVQTQSGIRFICASSTLYMCIYNWQQSYRLSGFVYFWLRITFFEWSSRRY